MSKPIGKPRSFMFDGEVWAVQELEPGKMGLPAHQSILYFRHGRQRRWVAQTRAILGLLSTRDLGDLVASAATVPRSHTPATESSSLPTHGDPRREP